MILIQQAYVSANPQRNAELEWVREANRMSGLFEHIEAVDPGGRRLTFADLMRMAESTFAGRPCVIANSDIAFDRSIRAVEPLMTDAAGPQMVVLSRWDDDTAPSMEGRIDQTDWGFYSHSQDAWAFVAGSLPAFEAGFRLGVPACESRLAFEAAAAGVAVVNPALSIRIRHHHASAIRTWRRSEAYRGPLLFPRLTTTDVGDRKAFILDRSRWPTRKEVVSLLGNFAPLVRRASSP